MNNDATVLSISGESAAPPILSTQSPVVEIFIADLERQRQELLQSLARVEDTLAKLGRPVVAPRRYRNVNAGN